METWDAEGNKEEGELVFKYLGRGGTGGSDEQDGWEVNVPVEKQLD